MITLIRTKEFLRWIDGLADRKARVRIAVRLTRAEAGHFGDCKPVGDGVSEMRVDHGPGYRIYFTRRGGTVYVLLIGGDKSTQARDIDRARGMARRLAAEDRYHDR